MTLAHIDALIMDMDGVLWRGDQPLPGLTPLFDYLHAQQIPYALATNNSSKTVAEYAAKLARFGLEAPPERIITSGVATARYLKKRSPGARVYVVGMPGLVQTMADAGFTIADEDVAFVVAGIDRGLTYAKVATANRLIRQGATFIGTNPDRTFPLPTGPAPGAGSILAAIATASDQEPTIIGKPYAAMFEQALDVVQTPAARTAMVGDRLETDILGGQRAGLRTVLVCTGINRREDLAASPVQPDFVFDDLPDFLHQWRAARSG